MTSLSLVLLAVVQLIERILFYGTFVGLPKFLQQKPEATVASALAVWTLAPYLLPRMLLPVLRRLSFTSLLLLGAGLYATGWLLLLHSTTEQSVIWPAYALLVLGSVVERPVIAELLKSYRDSLAGSTWAVAAAQVGGIAAFGLSLTSYAPITLIVLAMLAVVLGVLFRRIPAQSLRARPFRRPFDPTMVLLMPGFIFSATSALSLFVVYVEKAGIVLCGYPMTEGLSLALFSLSTIAFLPLTRIRSLSPYSLVFAATILPGVGWLVLSTGPVLPWLAASFLVLFGVAEAVVLPLSMACVLESAPPDRQVEAVTNYWLACGLGMCASLFVTLAWHKFQAETLFFAVGLVSLGCSIVALLIRRRATG